MNKYKLDYREMYKLRHKEKKTVLEQRLLDYRSTLCHISETLIDTDKQHISRQNAIENIRKYLSEVEI